MKELGIILLYYTPRQVVTVTYRCSQHQSTENCTNWRITGYNRKQNTDRKWVIIRWPDLIPMTYLSKFSDLMCIVMQWLQLQC